MDLKIVSCNGRGIKSSMFFTPMMDLKIVSYNGRGIKSSIPLLWKMCESNDIILLQETLLCSHDLYTIHTIHPDFYAGGCSSINSDIFKYLIV